jgi:hypothetical protein
MIFRLFSPAGFLVVAMLIISICASAQLSGNMELALAREGTQWKAEVKLIAGGKEMSGPARDLKISDTEISFKTDIEGAEVLFKGALDGPRLNGSLDIIEKGARVGTGKCSLARAGAAVEGIAGKWVGDFKISPVEQQQSDPNFDARIERPAYTKSHPKVLVDEAHNNFHTATGRYKPFADLITNDGYQVTANKEKFTKESLVGFNILVISNAMGPRGQRATPAFTEAEAVAVSDWVGAGGSLLLIADHFPMGSAAEILASRFNVEMSKGGTIDRSNYYEQWRDPGNLLFSRANGLLARHAITEGRGGKEKINLVISFFGQSLKGPAGSVAFLKLADTALDQAPPDYKKETSARGRAQGLALKFGKGRVVVMGEAAMLTAQISGPGSPADGLSLPGADNRQLALNIMHWLSGLLK